MKPTTSTAAAAIALAFANLGAALPAQSAPSESGPSTRARFLERRIGRFQDLFVTSYRARRTEKAPADAAVERFLRHFVQAEWDQTITTSYVRTALVREARRALESSDDDPVVLLAAGWLIDFGKQVGASRKMLERAAAALEAAAAPPALRFLAEWTLRLIAAEQNAPDEAASRGARCEDLLVAMGSDPWFAGPHERSYYDLVVRYFGSEFPLAAEDLVDRLAKAPGAHRAALDTLRGRLWTTKAWAARGTKTADKVTEQGWAGFGNGLRNARRALLSAWEARPLPETATAMLAVVSGLDGGIEEQMTWFERAVALEYDHIRAYEQLLHFSMPRWGGSHERMLSLAKSWVAAGRFDTRVPALYRDALGDIAQDYDDPSELFSSPLIQRTLRTVHEGYRKSTQTEGQRRWDLSLDVVCLALGKRGKQAAALWQSIDSGFDEGALAIYRVDKEWLAKALEGHLRPHAPVLVDPADPFAGYSDAAYDQSGVTHPIPHGPGAPTSATHRAAQDAWTTETLRAAWEAKGHHDPKWDAKVERLLSGYCDFLAATSDERRARYRSDVQDALGSGCDDPLVLYVQARAGEEAGAGAGRATIELLERCVAGFRSRGYPELFTFFAKRRLEAALRAAGRANEAEGYARQVAAHAVAMAGDACFAGPNARWYLATVVPDGDLGWRLGALSPEGARKIGANEKVDPWLRHLLAGLAHAAAATGAPLELEPAARRAYFEDVRQATARLAAAHDLHPEWTAAALAMIPVAALEPGPVTAREWFERAVGACFDHPSAYANFLFVQRPDKCGSAKAMYRFGVECLETGRFDTKVPEHYLEAVRTAAVFSGSLRRPWASPDVVARCEALIAGVAGAAKDTPRARHFEALRPLLAWAGGRYAEAVAGWEAAGRKIDDSWLGHWRTNSATVIGQLEALAAAQKR